MNQNTPSLSLADRLSIAATTIGGSAVVLYFCLPWAFDGLAALDNVQYPSPLDGVHVGSILFGAVFSNVVGAIPAIYRAQREAHIRDRKLIVCRD